MQREKGFTLLELIIVVIMLGIVLAIAVPNINSFLDRQKAVSAAESIYSQIVYARSEAISRSQKVAVVIDPNAWALGITDLPDDNPDCDPTVTDRTIANACVLTVDGTKVLKRIDGNDYPGVTVTSNTAAVVFDPVRGTATGNGTINIAFDNYNYDVIVSVMGRARICVDVDTTESVVGGYGVCP